MRILELANQLDISPKRVASTKGGEYHSACPLCGGKDRFIIWSVIDRYFCRQCEVSGDAIQFCRDFMGMDYRAACAKVGIQGNSYSHIRRSNTYKFAPEKAETPPDMWQKNANNFTMQCHQNLLLTKEALNLIQERGLSLETIHEYSLGWNPRNRFLPTAAWGLPASFKENGDKRKLWLPKGIMIPTASKETLTKLKIRRSEWQEQDSLPKYVEVSGSMKGPSLYGNVATGVIIIVEAEFDAILIQQVAADICCSMALGGAGKKPDADSHHLLCNASRLLYSLDFDDAGKKAFRFWKSTYANLRPWPTPKGKSPGDAFKLGVNLRTWILAGIRACT